MKISILMPTYNRLNLFKRALSSALKQDYKDLEILVIDNGSTDGTSEYLKTLVDTRIRIITSPTNRKDWINIGILRATGDLICQLHDDDEFYKNDSVSCRASVFDDPHIDVVYAESYNVYENGQFHSRTIADAPDKKRIWKDEYTNWTTYMWRKSIHDKIGMFPSELLYQWDRWFKVVSMMELKCVALPKLVMRYMVWHGQDSAHANQDGSIHMDSKTCEKLLSLKYAMRGQI